jgi:Stage II sporulation protein E (SpoIIE)
MMKRAKYARRTINVALGLGALLSLALCVQCVRTYLYTDAVLIPQQAEREAGRQAGVLSSAARRAAAANVRDLEPEIEQAIEASAGRIQWVRVMNADNEVLAQGGHSYSTEKVPQYGRGHREDGKPSGQVLSTPVGDAYVAMLPFRMPRPHSPDARGGTPELSQFAAQAGPPPGGFRGGGLFVEIAIPLSAVSDSFDGLRKNLVLGVVASIALFLAVVAFAVYTPHLFRGRYLEGELQLARKVQHDLHPRPAAVTRHIDFAASSVSSDHVGGDFHDVFETPSGAVAIVLGDVSGKGVSAALLASVIQGAIRSATAPQHETACEQVNRMLCERTSCERFATLFWGVFDPATRLLRYVNAGHAAPILQRSRDGRIERLHEGGPLLGILPGARFAAGEVMIEPGDSLVVYSDGVNEAANLQMEEFGEARIEQIVAAQRDQAPSPKELCGQIIEQVGQFVSSQVLADDRTLVAVRFQPAFQEAVEATSGFATHATLVYLDAA